MRAAFLFFLCVASNGWAQQFAGEVSKLPIVDSKVSLTSKVETAVPDVKRAGNWSPVAAARYLDQRAAWWETWPKSQRDHETVCVSCHTMVPYALARPRLRSVLGEQTLAAPERSMLGYVQKRVALWKDVQPYYLDAKSGPGKSRESRATEAVLNAFILANANAGRAHLEPLTRTAFENAWALQLPSGAWDWQMFHLSPWEATESQYQGATFMALALGWAPDRYRNEPTIRANVQALREYLRRQYAAQPLLNQVVVLWASGQLPGVLSRQERHELVAAISRKQQADGGWSLASLGNWTRLDHTAQESGSDGYATGVVTLALKQGELRGEQLDQWNRGLAWLKENQNRADGSWRGDSLNKQRDPATDVGRFMTDAATGYAVLALAGK